MVFIVTKIKEIFKKQSSQSNDSYIIEKLLKWHPTIPKSFIEFGFHAWEFNCVELAKNDEWEGLLIDTNPHHVRVAKILYHKNIKVINHWLNLEKLLPIYEFADKRKIGILSIDVDGNDFWFLDKLIDLKPAIVICEYNASFGLKMLSIPYDADFERGKKHNVEYSGASITAISHFMEKMNYSLMEISSLGNNGFFLRNDLLVESDIPLDPKYSLRECFFSKSSERHLDFWEKVKDLDYINIQDYLKNLKIN